MIPECGVPEAVDALMPVAVDAADDGGVRLWAALGVLKLTKGAIDDPHIITVGLRGYHRHFESVANGAGRRVDAREGRPGGGRFPREE